MRVLFEAPTIRRSSACRRLRRSVSTSPSQSFRCMALMLPANDCPPAVEASPGHSVFPEASAMPGRHRGVRLISLLVARAPRPLGHRVRLMPPAYVKPYVKRQKNDMADAEAICEAVTRANMRFVPTKTPEQQSGLVLHRTRHLFIRQQTSVINAIRAHLAEFGVIAPVGRLPLGCAGYLR